MDKTMQVLVSQNPGAQIFGGSESVLTIDITHCLGWLRTLYHTATIVNENPGCYGDVTKILACGIEEVARALPPDQVREILEYMEQVDV